MPTLENALENIRRGFRGETVAPPPKFYNDSGDLMDVQRTLGWLIWVAVGADEEQDTAFHAHIFDARLDEAYLVGSDMKSGHNTPSEVLSLLLERIHLPVSDYAKTPKRFQGHLRVPAEEKTQIIIQKIMMVRTAVLADGEADGYPDLSDANRMLLGTVLGEASESMSASKIKTLLVDTRASQRMVVIPKIGTHIAPGERELVAEALVDFSMAMKAFAEKEVLHPAQNARWAEKDREKRKACEARVAMIEAQLLSKHEKNLEKTEEGRLLAARLRGERDVPAYESRLSQSQDPGVAARYATRNAHYRALLEFLGENGPDILRGLIRTDFSTTASPDMVLSKKETCFERLDEALSLRFSFRAEDPSFS